MLWNYLSGRKSMQHISNAYDLNISAECLRSDEMQGLYALSVS